MDYLTASAYDTYELDEFYQLDRTDSLIERVVWELETTKELKDDYSTSNYHNILKAKLKSSK